MRLVARSVGAALLLLGGCGGGDEGKGDPFAEGVITTYEITMDPADWDAMVAQPAPPAGQEDPWRRMSFTWQGETWTDVAVHPSGKHTRIAGNPKPSLHLSFEEFIPGRHFHTLPSLKLNSLIEDPTMIRERLAFPLFRSLGLSAPRTAYARVYVNGSYKGLYAVVERITKAFVKNRFGREVNQLYEWTGRGPDFVWNGGPATYVPDWFNPKIDSLDPDAAGIETLLRTINLGTYDEAAAIFDVEVFLRMIAVEVVTGELDGYLGGPSEVNRFIWVSNFYLYRTPATGKYTMIPWDRGGDFQRPAQEPITSTFDQRVLTRKLILERPENLARLKELMRELLSGQAETGALQARAGAAIELIQDAMTVEPANNFAGAPTPQDWRESAAALKDAYIPARTQAVAAQLPP